MPDEKVPKAIASAEFTLLGVVLKCHVLDNGQRVIEDSSVHELLEAMGNPATQWSGKDHETMAEFNVWRMQRDR